MEKIIDVSKKRQLKKAIFWHAEINQLYHPTGYYKNDTFDIVYSSDQLGNTKFTPILLKEWFWLLKENGLLIIDYKPNQICDFKILEETMWWLWRKRYEIIYHGAITSRQRNHIKDFTKSSETFDTPYKENGYLRFICKKKVSTSRKGDSINKWSFGIITNGKRIDWIRQIIATIKSQRIPNFEIIICGDLPQLRDKSIVHIPFSQRNDKGWISKKKNLIVDTAKYENLCIIHDRISLKKDWFKGMKKWGNTFEHLSCPQFFKNKRTNDWLLHEKLPGVEFSFVSHLDYRDWDVNACQGGQLHILKKSIVKERYWNEAYHWGRAEDVELTNSLRDLGYIIRCNPFSSFDTFFYKFGDIPTVIYNPYHLSDKRQGDKKRIFSRKIYSVVYKNVLLRNFLLKFFYKLSQ